jgi:hypothetical protein
LKSAPYRSQGRRELCIPQSQGGEGKSIYSDGPEKIMVGREKRTLCKTATKLKRMGSAWPLNLTCSNLKKKKTVSGKWWEQKPGWNGIKGK